MIDAAIRKLVRERAHDRCEYCTLPQSAAPLARFHVEHIVSRQHGGSDEPSNLALACYHCNLHKGPNLAGIDPESHEKTELFDPRRMKWQDHFERIESLISGLTAIGRTTVAVLAMNSEPMRLLRAEAE